MKKLGMLGIIGGAALLTVASPFSLQWSQDEVSLSLNSANARVGRPLTATNRGVLAARGRPATGQGLLIGVRLRPQQVAALDDWRSRQPKAMSRPAAMRKLIAMALFGNGG